MHQQIKVCFLLGSLNRGGTETLMLDIFNRADKSSFGIIGIYRKKGLLEDSFHASKVNMFKLTPGSLVTIWLYPWRLRKLLKREKVDVVHAQQSLDAVYAWLACIGLRIKVVQTFHGYDFVLGHFHRLLIRLSLKITDMNIFVSKTQSKYYASAYKLNQRTKKAVVYNGINFEKLGIGAQNSIRIQLGISEKSLLMGMVGNFVPVRDQMTVCRFLNLLNTKGIDFRFLFIGKKDNANPQLFDDCYYFCQNKDLTGKVMFLGPRSDVSALLPQLDVFIYSTNHDTFGIAVVEAIASGIPVFVNDWEVMREITEDGRRASLYRSKDEIDLLDKVLSYIAHQESFRKSALENAEWARKTYNIENCLKRLNEVYGELI